MQTLEKDREHEDRAVQREPEHRGNADAGGKLPALEDAEVDYRLLCGELTPQKQHERHRGNDSEHRHEPRLEPIVSLAALEHPLQRADTQGEQENSLIV